MLINGGSAGGGNRRRCPAGPEPRDPDGHRQLRQGLVQTVLPLNTAPALKLTTALYYTPNGAPSRPRASFRTSKSDAPR
ncbi:hypothetical protein ACPA9J_20475 [Pseudomonas aeruginosa]